MEPFSYYRQYSLRGVVRHGRKPSKRDLPKEFVDLMERMGFKIDNSTEWVENCIGISRGVGTDYIARFDFKEGILIAKEEEKLDRIKPLGLEKLRLRNVCFQIPDTYGGGSMMSQSDINERIPEFRDYLEANSFCINTMTRGSPEVRKKFVTRRCGELWSGCIEVFPNEPWGEELYRVCKEYRTSD